MATGGLVSQRRGQWRCSFAGAQHGAAEQADYRWNPFQQLPGLGSRLLPAKLAQARIVGFVPAGCSLAMPDQENVHASMMAQRQEIFQLILRVLLPCLSPRADQAGLPELARPHQCSISDQAWQL
jgi:hypothetical protein